MRLTEKEINQKRANRESVILFAGATSFLGCRLAIDYLDKGYHVIFLVRTKNNESPIERLDSLFSIWGFKSLKDSKFTVLDAQLDEDKLGLSDSDYNYIVENTDEIIHSAANTDMEEKNKVEVQRFNIQGTQNLLNVAAEGKAYFFHFMSTSYSCGKNEGTINETWEEISEFYNPYEESKNIAEKSIIDTCTANQVRYHIFRPSIVFGDSKTGMASRFNAFYYFVRTLDYIKNVYEKDFDKGGKRASEIGVYRTSEGKLHLPLRIEIKENSFFNIIPIDYFIEASLAIIEESLDGGIFHIVNPKPTTLKNVLDNFMNFCNLEGLEAVPEDVYCQKEPNVIEKLYQEYMEIYKPYFRDTKIFDDTNTQKITSAKGIKIGQLADEAVFNRCVGLAMHVKYGKFLAKYVENPESMAPMLNTI